MAQLRGASTTLDTAVRNSIASGVTYAVAAGNSSANASPYSPAQVATALVNGATSNVVTSPGTGSPNKLLKIVP